MRTGRVRSSRWARAWIRRESASVSGCGRASGSVLRAQPLNGSRCRPARRSPCRRRSALSSAPVWGFRRSPQSLPVCRWLAAGAKVLVHGGAGAVGHAAIELGHWHGAHVATTVSSAEKAELARAAGAELVIDYRSEPVAERLREWAPDGVTRIVEVNLPANLSLDTEVLAAGGVVSCYTAPPHAVELSRSLMVLNAHVAFVLVYTIPLEAKLAAVADISRALRDGALTPLPEHRFTLEQIAAAHDAVEQGAIGKVLVELP